MIRYFGLFLFVIGFGLLASLFYARRLGDKTAQPFSDYTLLTSSWEKYKTRFINQDGRVIDYSQNSVTTSEGQSYALLQSVWVDDKETFDKVLAWTRNTLKRPDDQLFGWRWGEKDDNSYGFLDDGGENSASDADSDIALALILAAKRWNQQEYLTYAREILKDMWNLETDEVKGQRYLVAGNWARSQDRVVINPSYFSPYAWRLFAELDPDHDWLGLINPAYELLAKASQTQLTGQQPAGLPPDWVSIDRQNGQLSATNIPGLSTNYSFDAMRIPWRIALDYAWFQEGKARDYLQTLSFLRNKLETTGMLAGSFDHAGQPIYEGESPVMYATSLGYLMIADPSLAERVYQEKIIRLYSNDTNSFRDDLPYYEANWLWFGAALYKNYAIPFN